MRSRSVNAARRSSTAGLSLSGQLEWRFGKERFCRLGFELVSCTNRLRADQSYKEARSALSYGFSCRGAKSA